MLYLSLQGHTRSTTGVGCSFGILVNGRPINSAPREENPSYTQSTTWEPAFMAEALTVEDEEVKVGLQISDNHCYIHDADVNGIYIPTNEL